MPTEPAATVAARALDAWKIRDAQLTLLRDRDNTTFAVDIAGARCYALRVCRPDARRATRTIREFAWLRALRRDTDIGVPEPVAMYVDEHGERVSAMSRWLEGEAIHPTRITAREAYKVGRIMAKLHQHAARWTRPPVPSPPSSGLWWTGQALKTARSHFNAAENTVIDIAKHVFARTCETLIEDGSAYGLIHADLTPENCIEYQGSIRPIDFNDATYGFFAYDLAVTLAAFRPRNDYDSLAEATLAGYRSICPLPTDDRAMITHLVAVRLASQAIWLAAHISEPQFPRSDLERAKCQLAVAAKSLHAVGGREKRAPVTP